MSRINSNVPSLIAQRHLGLSQQSLTKSLERLSSGLKINRGADNPAGLIVSERLRSEIAVVQQAIDNSTRAINVVATTEGALNEVQTLLTDIQAKLVEAANSGAFSKEEIAANQLQIDNAIDSITRIANTTTFAGRKLINGELDYVTSGVTAANLFLDRNKYANEGFLAQVSRGLRKGRAGVARQRTQPQAGGDSRLAGKVLGLPLCHRRHSVQNRVGAG